MTVNAVTKEEYTHSGAGRSWRGTNGNHHADEVLSVRQEQALAARASRQTQKQGQLERAEGENGGAGADGFSPGTWHRVH